MARAPVDDRIERLITLAAEAGEETLAEDARALSFRAAKGLFYVACVGQFKRGKSTLLDAFLGEPILPIGALPVTTVPTLIRFGRGRSARIRAGGSEWMEISLTSIADFATESENPGNWKQVAAIEVILPAPVLMNGLCFVDTPGLGSVHEWNSEATQQIVPQVDVGLLVTGADPPITGEELKLVESILDRTSRLIVVINKADLSSPTAIAEAADFARRVIRERTGHELTDVFVTNAKAHLDGAAFSDEWELLRERLTSLAGGSRAEIVDSGVRHGMRRIGDRLLWAIDEETSMLQRPIEDSKAHIEYLVALSLDVERSIGDLRQILIGEQSRFVHLVEDDRRSFVADAVPRAQTELREAMDRSILRGTQLRRELSRTAQDIAERLLNPWLRSEEKRIGELYSECELRFVELARAFLNRLAPLADSHLGNTELFADMQPFREKSAYYYHRLETVAASASPVRVIVDALRSVTGARSGIERDVRRYLARLLEANASRIEFDLRERLDNTRQGFEAGLIILLRDILSSARRNLHRARETHARGIPAIEGRLQLLRARAEEIRSIRVSAAEPDVRVAEILSVV